MTAPGPFKSDFMRVLSERGYIHQGTDLEGLDQLAAASSLTGYIGFDATAPSLHVGSLMQIMLLRRLQQTGHRPIVLMGGATTKVGDPSGKDATRPLLTDELVAANIAGIRKVFDRFLTFDGPTGAVMVNNADWVEPLGYLDFLRKYGSHFTINRMLTFDSVKLRLDREQALTFLEFNYMLVQAVDFLELHRRHGCRLQLGGSDQWGNIVNGVELVRRIDGEQAFGITTPLIVSASGVKMGKTAAGAVWLNAEQLSPYDYWQFWRNTDDGDVGCFLRLFTDVPLTEVARLEALQGAESNEAKKVLADEATSMLHGEAAANAARAAAEGAFERGQASADLPTVDFDWAGGQGHTLRTTAAIVHATGLTRSLSDARRQIAGGAVRINGVKISDDRASLRREDAIVDGAFKVQLGKKKIVLVRPT